MGKRGKEGRGGGPAAISRVRGAAERGEGVRARSIRVDRTGSN